ncbi:MAG: hypothetical protein U0790_09825 [Isosphaeraceae bacterium]
MSTPVEADLPAFARAGWTAVELWLTKLEAYLAGHGLDELRALLGDQGLVAAAAAGQGASCSPGARSGRLTGSTSAAAWTSSRTSASPS